MKKGIVLIIMLIFFSSALKAQDKAKPFDFNLRIGPNIGWFKSNSDVVNNNGSKMGFSWSVTCEFPMKDNFSFVSGFDIHSVGGKIDYSGFNQGVAVGINEQYTLKYLELPVMMKIRTREVNKVLYYGQLGLGTAFRINSRIERSFKLPPTSSVTMEEQDLSSDNLTSFIRESLLFGVGAQYSLQDNLKLFGGLNFNNGLTDILKKGPYNASDPKVISNFVELTLGLYF